MDRNGSEGRLFFAVLPDAATAARISRLAGILKRAHGFRAGLMESSKLHVSLFFLGSLCEPMVRLARGAAADVEGRAFEVWFDRTVSFHGKPGNYPFVLAGDSGVDQLKSFGRLLGAALTRRGLRRLASREFTPHVTLLYGEHQAEENPVEPVGWTVNEFALIHSRYGHDRIGTWSLRS